MEWTILYERELICPICDARALTYATERERVKRCPECGCAADLHAVYRSSPFEMVLVWGTLIACCGLFWYAVIMWLFGE